MVDQSPLSDLTFLGSSHRLARYLGRPFHRFMAVEISGGIVLLVATVAALIWANSPWQDTYHSFWATHFEFSIGNYHFSEELDGLVQDGLMAIFFFVVGLEIKGEIVNGQLRDPHFAALPVVAALGGMVVPAAIFLAFNAGGPGQDGWGIPMATDIAFAIGVISLLGSRVPHTMKVFLLTLAIVDDIGAILVIAIFYTNRLSTGWLLVAGILLAGIYVLRRMRVWYLPVYVAIGVAFWLAVLESGVHATIAGVILGFMTPAKPLQSEDDARHWARWLEDKEKVSLMDVRRAEFHIRESQPVTQRIEELLHPLASYIIIPIFALSAAGVELSGNGISDAATSKVTMGVVLGLVVGKTLGISLFSWGAARLGLVNIPPSMTGIHMLGLAMVAGIGFTVSLFITGLAYTDQMIQDQAKIGILFASLIAAVGGIVLLSLTSSPDDETADQV